MRLTTCVSALILLCLSVTAQAQQRFRMGDPNILTGKPGWSVSPRLQELKVIVPVAAVPGDIPVDLAVRVNGAFRCNFKQRYMYDFEFQEWMLTNTWESDEPAYGTLHFGYIAGPNSTNGSIANGIYVLEDGTQFSSADFGPFSSFHPSFTLAQDFGLPVVPVSALKVDVTGTYATYITTLDAAGLGSWASKIIQPTGYGAISKVQVLMDAGRARVYGYLAPYGPWVPLLWMDKWGHWVSFQWSQTLTGLPTSLAAVRSVQVLNQHQKGLLLQWAAFTDASQVQDLARVDYVGIDAPSVQVKGYPGTSNKWPVGYHYGWSTAVPEDVSSYTPASGSGPVGRPTSIVMGASDDTHLPSPSWIPYGRAIPPRAGTASATFTQWQIGWDANQASIASIDEPSGLHTAFTSYSSSLISGGFVTSVFPNKDRTEHLPYATWCLREATTTDPHGGGTLSRRWSYESGAADPTVVYRESFGSLDTTSRETRLTFTQATLRDKNNGALKAREIRELPSGRVMERTDYALAGGGTDASLSVHSNTTFTRNGEPTRTTNSSSDGDLYRLYSRTEGLFVGNPSISTLNTTRGFLVLKDKLELARLTSTQVVRFSSAGGGALSPSASTYFTHNGLGQVATQYQYVGPSQIGQRIDYDGDGRPSAISVLNTGASSPTRSQATAYDSATGSPSSQITTYSTGTGALASISQNVTSFDSFGRPLVSTDARGVTTTTAYDLRGRVKSVQVGSDPATTYDYPSEQVTVRSQAGVNTRETRDGFGRVVKTQQYTLGSDQASEISLGETRTTYDEFGRVRFFRQISSGNVLAAPRGISYDSLDRPVQVVDPQGHTTTYAYAADGLLAKTTVVADPAGFALTTTTWIDAFGQVVKTLSPTGITTTTTYDGMGNVLTVTVKPATGDPQTRTWTYDDIGRMLTRTEPETGTTTFSNFNALNLPTTITEDKGSDNTNRTRNLTYDGLGRVELQRNLATGEYLSSTYAGADLKRQTTQNQDTTLVTQEFRYAGPNHRVDQEQTSFSGNTWTIGYGFDALNRLGSMTYPSGRVVGYEYDGANRVVSVTQNGSPVVSNITFNPWGQRARMTFGSGAYSEWTTKDFGLHLDRWNIGYNAGGLTDSANLRVFQYDSAERLSQAGEWSQISYDKENRLLSADGSPMGVSSTFGHDGYGNNISHTTTGSPAVNNFTFGPQIGNQIPSLTLSQQATGWVYSARGEAFSVSRGLYPSGPSQGVTWDGLGRLSTVVDTSATTRMTYAPSGMRVSATDTGASANNRQFAYSASGLLLSEFGAGGGSGGGASQAVSGNGSGSTSTTHSGNKAVRIWHKQGTNCSLSRWVGTFASGDVVTAKVWFKAEPGVHGEFFFGDAGGQDPYDNYKYMYADENGQWQCMTLTHTMSHSDEMYLFIYGDKNYSTSDSVSVLYDDVIVESAMKGLVLNEGFESALDGWGSAGQPNDIVSAPTLRDVIYLDGQAIAEVDANGVHELHSDHLGTPRIITHGANGKIEGRQAYAAYGEKILSEGYVPLTGYTGHLQADPSGLIYMRGRFYSPAWHTFLNSDQGVDPNSLNQRAYVGGSPFMATDPSGMSAWGEFWKWWTGYGGGANVPVEDTWSGVKTIGAGRANFFYGKDNFSGQTLSSSGDGGGKKTQQLQTPAKKPDCPDKGDAKLWPGTPTGDDYVSTVHSYGPGFGIISAYTTDRFGNRYHTYGGYAGKSISPIGYSKSYGTLDIPGGASEGQLKNFLGGWGYNGGINAILGFGFSYSTSSNATGLEGTIGVPGVGIQGGYTTTYAKSSDCP